MEGRGPYLRVGLLVIAGVALVFALIWFFGGNRANYSAVYESYFRESVQGLEVGSAVKYLGVTIGRVTDIGLVSAEYGRDEPLEIERQTYRLVFVRYAINPRRVGKLPTTEMAVRTGLRARLASQGITGLSYLELDFVDPKRYPPQPVPWTPKADYIPSIPSTLAQVQDAATQLLTKLDQADIVGLMASLTALSNDLRTELATGEVHQTLAQANALLATLAQTAQAADLPGLTADLRQTSTALRDVVQGPQLKALMANATRATEQLSIAAARLPPLIAALQATSRRAGDSTADVQQSLAPLLRDIQAATSNLRETTDALRQYPAQVLLSGPPPRKPEPAR